MYSNIFWKIQFPLEKCIFAALGWPEKNQDWRGSVLAQDEYHENGIGKLHFYADGEGEYGA